MEVVVGVTGVGGSEMVGSISVMGSGSVLGVVGDKGTVPIA